MAGQRCCLVYEDYLLQLATLKVDSKCRVEGCESEYIMQLKRVGSTALLIWTCVEGHKGRRWSSQTKLRKLRVYAGDFLLATNILLSGNNFTKVALLFKFMNLGMVSRVQFERIQALYVVPTIMGYWERLRTATVQQLQGTYLLDTGRDRRVSMSSYFPQPRSDRVNKQMSLFLFYCSV